MILSIVCVSNPFLWPLLQLKWQISDKKINLKIFLCFKLKTPLAKFNQSCWKKTYKNKKNSTLLATLLHTCFRKHFWLFCFLFTFARSSECSLLQKTLKINDLVHCFLRVLTILYIYKKSQNFAECQIIAQK